MQAAIEKGMGIKEETIKMKAAAPYLAASSVEQRNKALLMVAENLRANAAKILKRINEIWQRQKKIILHRQ